MTDLDFDELDKAVSDLMNDAGPEAAPTDVSQTPNGPAPQAAATTSVSTSPQDNTTPSSDTPVADTSLAVKRRGKFMDFVPAPAGAKPVQMPQNREAPAIVVPTVEQSESQSVEPVAVDVESTEDKPAPQEPVETPEETSYAANPAPANEWPDPIDVMQQHDMADQTTPESTDNNTVHDEPKEDVVDESGGQPESTEELSVPDELLDDTASPHELPTENSVTPDEQEQLVSPFLPDAKVEKRPLGEFTADQAPAEAESTDTAAEMPPELHSEVMGLETDQSTIDQGKAAQVEEQINDSTVPAEAEEAPSQPVTAPVASESTTPAGPQVNGAIYDTDAYHTPLAAAPKKQSSKIAIIIWILALIIVGACAGAVFFYFTTQR